MNRINSSIRWAVSVFPVKIVFDLLKKLFFAFVLNANALLLLVLQVLLVRHLAHELLEQFVQLSPPVAVFVFLLVQRVLLVLGLFLDLGALVRLPLLQAVLLNVFLLLLLLELVELLDIRFVRYPIFLVVSFVFHPLDFFVLVQHHHAEKPIINLHLPGLSLLLNRLPV